VLLALALMCQLFWPDFCFGSRVAVYFEDPVVSVLCDAGSFGFRRARQKQTSK